MDIKRHGAQRYRGTTTVLSNLSLTTGKKYAWENTVRWDNATKQIEIRDSWVPAQDGRTRHTYYIRLSLDDVTALISLLGHAASAEDATLLRDRLGKDIPALVKLLACATGIVPTPMQ